MPSKQVPSFGIIASTVLASAAMIINCLGSSGATVFTALVLMTGVTSRSRTGSPRSRISNGAGSTTRPWKPHALPET